jgi:hypothetical protein
VRPFRAPQERRSRAAGARVAARDPLLRPAPFEFSDRLTKARAEAKTRTVADYLCGEVDRCNTSGVDDAEKCERIASLVIECGYALHLSSDVRCADTMRIRLIGQRTYASFPYEADCAFESNFDIETGPLKLP